MQGQSITKLEGFKTLTMPELVHLIEMGITTTKDAEETFTYQKQHRIEQGANRYEPCWNCKLIAKKLGYPV
jgi:hypothetical protein